MKEPHAERLRKFLRQVEKRLVVSCQALADEALFGSDIMARMAKSVARGGACAIRANTPADVYAIRQAVELPIIGLYKDKLPGYEVIITPTLSHALEIAAAGADVIAVDGTKRPHPDGELGDLFANIHHKSDCLIMADISTVEEGLAAEAAGADMLSTTLSGYTSYSPQQAGPDLDLVERLAAQSKIPVFAEGRFHTPEQVKEALDKGAFSVVVGGAITRPWQITERFVKTISQ